MTATAHSPENARSTLRPASSRIAVKMMIEAPQKSMVPQYSALFRAALTRLDRLDDVLELAPSAALILPISR